MNVVIFEDEDYSMQIAAEVTAEVGRGLGLVVHDDLGEGRPPANSTSPDVIVVRRYTEWTSYIRGQEDNVRKDSAVWLIDLRDDHAPSNDCAYFAEMLDETLLPFRGLRQSPSTQ